MKCPGCSRQSTKSYGIEICPDCGAVYEVSGPPISSWKPDMGPDGHLTMKGVVQAILTVVAIVAIMIVVTALAMLIGL